MSRNGSISQENDSKETLASRNNTKRTQIDNIHEFTIVLPEYAVRKDPFRSQKSQGDDVVETRAYPKRLGLANLTRTNRCPGVHA